MTTASTNATEPDARSEELKDTTKKVSYICPHCRQLVTIENHIVDDIVFTCPYCTQKGIIRAVKKNKDKIVDINHVIKFAHEPGEKKHVAVPSFQVKIFGLLLIIFGITIEYFLNNLTFKIIFTFVTIGFIIFIFIPNNRKIYFKPRRLMKRDEQKNIINTNNNHLKYFSYNYLNKQFNISEKIALILIFWIVLFYFLPGIQDIEVFIIFVYLGILFVKVFSTGYVSAKLQQKINVFTFVFLILFILLIIRRIYIFLNI